MATLSLALKALSLRTGLYRPARWLATRVRPRQFKSFRQEVEFYRSLLPSNAFCFDIGANIGDKSEALLAAGARRVVAFEPNPLVVPELRARCGHDRRWTLVEAAVGRHESTQTLYARASHGSSSMARDWGGPIVSEFAVPVTTLDSAISAWGVPDYCKIDVEGWELEVLSGLTQRIPLVSFEFHLNAIGIESAKACLTHLARFQSAGVNITPAESARFHLSEWKALDDFLKWFPGDLRQTLPGDNYGDVYVSAHLHSPGITHVLTETNGGDRRQYLPECPEPESSP